MKAVVAVWCLALAVVPSTVSADHVRKARPAAASPSPPVVAYGGGINWVGWAVSPPGDVFRSVAASEAAAQAQARNECEQTTAKTCASYIAIPTSGNWKAAAVLCANVESFVAGSRLDNAVDVARDKAKSAGFPPDSCEEIYSE
jgi:hypothetical protein